MLTTDKFEFAATRRNVSFTTNPTEIQRSFSIYRVP